MFLALTAAELSLMDNTTDLLVLPVQTQLTLCFTDLKTHVTMPEEGNENKVEVQGILRARRFDCFLLCEVKTPAKSMAEQGAWQLHYSLCTIHVVWSWSATFIKNLLLPVWARRNARLLPLIR